MTNKYKECKHWEYFLKLNLILSSFCRGHYITLPPRIATLSWVTERMRSQIQLAEMSFLHRVTGLTLRDRVRSSDIRRELGVQLLLICVKRSQLRWFRQLNRMLSLERFLGQVQLVAETRVDPEHAGEIIHISSGLGTPQASLGGAGKHCRDRSTLHCHHKQASNKRQKMDR